MPRGSKRSYTSKQKRQARHIEDSARKSGKSPARAKQIAYATVNKQDGGGKQRGAGRGKARGTSSTSASRSRTPSRKGRRAAARKRGGRTS